MIDRQRLRDEMQLKGFSQASLAAAAGVSPASIQQILNGSTKQPRSIRSIAAALGVKSDWLEGVSEHKVRELSENELEGDREPRLVAYLTDQLEVLTGPENTPVNYRRILMSQSWYDKIVGGRHDSVVMYQITSNEMAPTLMPGDDTMVAVAEEFDGDNGSIWLLSYSDRYQIRRIRRRSSGSLEMFSDNPIYPVESVSDDEVGMIGKIIWQGRRLSHS